MKIQNVLDTSSKKSAMDYWIDNAFITKSAKSKKKRGLPKLGKTFTGTDYGPPEDNDEQDTKKNNS